MLNLYAFTFYVNCEVVCQRETIAYKCSRTEGGNAGNTVAPEESAFQNSIPEYGQLHGGGLYQPQGGHPLPRASTGSSTALELVHSAQPLQTNVVADRESREFIDNSDWKIDPVIISPFPRGCSTDLFASRLTHQLARYISWRPDPQAFHSDAFSVNWKHLEGYAFPPFNLIARVLDKVMLDKTDLVLVAPIWQAQPWWPLLLGMLIQQPVLLPSSTTLLIDPTDLQRIHPMSPRLHLGVFHISSNDIRQRAFRETLPNYLSQQLEIPHRKHTSPVGNAGAAGVIEGKLILFKHP